MDVKGFWQNIKSGHKHFVDKMSPKKKSKLLGRARDYLLKYLPPYGGPIVDWGCGGGLIAKELLKYTDDLILVDILEESLHKAKEYIQKEVPSYVLNIDNPPAIGPVYAIFCSDVIQHFPSVEYFDKVLSIWMSYEPEYILIHTKSSSQNETASNYEKDYVNGLKLNKQYVLEQFKDFGYQHLCHSTFVSDSGHEMISYVFRREG